MTEYKTITEDINKALSGNQKSYSNLYAYLAPILRKTIKRKIYGVPSHLAKDILQDIFVKVFLKLNTFKPDNSFTSWAISIAVHHIIDLSRKRRLDVVLSENVEIFEQRILETQYDCYYYEKIPFVDVYELAYKYLDFKSRSIIIGKYFSGLKQKDVAANLTMPIGSISGIQSQAIGKLRIKIFSLGLDRSNFL